MEEETARRLCSLIAGVICSDGEMSPDERDFLRRMMTQCGLETDTALMPTYQEDVASELAELPEAMRGEAFGLVVMAAAVDGKITPQERAIIDAVAAPLGIGEEQILERLRQALPQA
jgi:tellurite resistance protein